MKPSKDETSPVDTYKVPESAAAVYRQICDEAKATYVDHERSRETMIRQRLLEVIADRDAEIAKLNLRVADLANVAPLQ